MRQLRVREIMLLVLVVALALGWAIDRTRLASHSVIYELHRLELMDRVNVAETIVGRLDTELAECRQGRGDD